MLFRKRLPSSAALAILALSGCARQGGSVAITGPGVSGPGATAIDHSRVQTFGGDKGVSNDELAAQATLTCETQDCGAAGASGVGLTASSPAGSPVSSPVSSVGMLLVLGAATPQRCALFVVSDDLIATSRACLGGMGVAGADCSGQAWAVFPAVAGLAAETIECSDVEAVVPATSGQTGLDFALLKLKSSIGRPALQASRAGVSDGLAVRVYDVTLAPKDPLSGVLRELPCVARQRTLVVPSFSDDRRPIVALAECAVDAGSAGAPVVDEHGVVRALMKGPVASASGAPAFALASNLGCVPRLPSDLPTPADLSGASASDSSAQAECDLGPGAAPTLPVGTSGASAEITVEESAGLQSWIGAQLTQWAADPATKAATAVAKWTLMPIAAASPIGLDIKARMFTAGVSYDGLYGGTIPAGDPQRGGDTLSFVAPRPTCILPATLESYRRKWYDIFESTYPSSASVDVQIPVWRGSVSIGRDEQVDLGRIELFRAAGKLEFNPSDAVRKGSSSVRLSSADLGFLGDLTFFQGELPVCKP